MYVELFSDEEPDNANSDEAWCCLPVGVSIRNQTEVEL